MNANSKIKNVLGIGSPLVDLFFTCRDDELAELMGSKGGMLPVTPQEAEQIYRRKAGTFRRMAGGAVANTLTLTVNSRVHAAILGKTGNDDLSRFYLKTLQNRHIDCRYIYIADGISPVCVIAVTPDGERTMRSALGVSLDLTQEEISRVNFNEYYVTLAEGFLIFTPWFEEVCRLARKQSRLALDLASYHLVERYRGKFERILRNGVWLLLANEDEAKAYTGEQDPGKILDLLAPLAEIAVIKLGKRGAALRCNGRNYLIPVEQEVHAVDSTGAGDSWTAGFLRAIFNGAAPEVAAAWGNRMAGEVVQQIGAIPDEATCQRIQQWKFC